MFPMIKKHCTLKRILFLLIIINSILDFTPLWAKEDKTVIKADHLNKENRDTIRAVGDVEIINGNRIINANEVEYNQTTKEIKANSAVKVRDTAEDQMFFSKTANMTDDLMKADFDDGILLFKNGSSIRSSHITKIGKSDIKLKKTRYSICPTNLYDTDMTYEEIMAKLDKKKTPLFSLRSSKATANTEKKFLKFWGTSVWIWKIPIFYIPYFKTGMAFDNDVNGFEVPGIESNSNYGYSIYMPYNFVTKRQKLKITPRVYFKGNYSLAGEYDIKSLENRWRVNFKGDVVNDNGHSKKFKNAYDITEVEEGVYKKWRGYAALKGFYDITDTWTFDFNSAIASDQYYLRDYFRDGQQYIESNFRINRVNLGKPMDFNYFQFSNLFYQDLLEDDSNYNLPRYAPITDTNIQNTIHRNKMNNLFYNVKLNTTSLFRKNGVEYNRFTLTPKLNNTFNSKFGTITSNFELRGDLYLLNEVGGNRSNQYRDTSTRILPQFNIEWRKSFASANFLFQPIIKYSVSPNSRGFEEKIPNEDSVPYGISFENIFSNNRFIGYDRQEFGNRLTYGFQSTLFNRLNIGIAQGYRDIIDDNYRLIGFENNLSDYVGYVSYIINDNFDLYYRFLTDRENFNFKKNEVALNFNSKYFGVFTSFVDLDKDFLYNTRQQQLGFGAYFTIFKKWTIAGSAILDIQNNYRFLESRASLTYDGGCTRWGISFRNYNPLTSTTKSTSVDFNFTIKFE